MTDTLSSTGISMTSARVTARALLLGDRLEVAGLERSDLLSGAYPRVKTHDDATVLVIAAETRDQKEFRKADR